VERERTGPPEGVGCGDSSSKAPEPEPKERIQGLPRPRIRAVGSAVIRCIRSPALVDDHVVAPQPAGNGSDRSKAKIMSRSTRASDEHVKAFGDV
jgi:hypothetical protein